MIPVGRDFSPVKPTSAPCLVVTLAKGRPAPAASSERAAACGSEGFSGKRWGVKKLDLIGFNGIIVGFWWDLNGNLIYNNYNKNVELVEVNVIA